MPVPSLRAMRRAQLPFWLVLVAIGVAVWYFVIRDDDDAPQRCGQGAREAEARSRSPTTRSSGRCRSPSRPSRSSCSASRDDPGAPACRERTRRRSGADARTGCSARRRRVAELKAASIPSARRRVAGRRRLPLLPGPAAARARAGHRPRRLVRTPRSSGRRRPPRRSPTPASTSISSPSPMSRPSTARWPGAPSPTTRRRWRPSPRRRSRVAKTRASPARPLHFPGLGAASQDTADGPATISSPGRGSHSSRDLVPFRAVAKDAPAMVLSLGLYPDFDAVDPRRADRRRRHRAPARRHRLQRRRDLRRPRVRRHQGHVTRLPEAAVRRSPPGPTWSSSPRPRTPERRRRGDRAGGRGRRDRA